MAFEVTGNELTIRFDNQRAAQHFKDWLDGQGEQDYWLWMECREKEEPEGNITVREFNYHEPGGSIIVATCGRMDHPD